jgi:hypothetical protein
VVATLAAAVVDAEEGKDRVETGLAPSRTARILVRAGSGKDAASKLAEELTNAWVPVKNACVTVKNVCVTVEERPFRAA